MHYADQVGLFNVTAQAMKRFQKNPLDDAVLGAMPLIQKLVAEGKHPTTPARP